MKRSEFAAKIKSQHPEYQDMSDEDLTKRVLAKFPQYADMVDKGPELASDETIQRNVETAPSRQSGGMETAVGTALTGGLGALFPNFAQQLGRGAEDASARMVNNVTNSAPPERVAAINAQLTPETTGEQIGQMIPGAAISASPLGPFAGPGLATLADTGDPETALKAAAASRLGQGIAGKLAQWTPAVKWAHIQAIMKLISGDLTGAGKSVARSAGPKLGSILRSVLAPEASAAAAVTPTVERAAAATEQSIIKVERDLAKLIQKGQLDRAGRLLWKLLPPAIAHGMNTPSDYDSTDRTMIADSPDALAQIVKKRRDAMQVLR